VRLRLALLFAAAAVSIAPAGDPDSISMIRIDGAPGWSATIPQDPHPDGITLTPLTAPTWFAKIADAKLALAPDGNFEFSSARGKVLLLDFWASWCPPCIKELPHLQSLHAARAKDGLVTVAVNADEGATVAAESAKRLGLTMPIAVNDPDVYRALGVRTLPTLLVIDRQGRLRSRWDGFRPGLENEIAAAVDKLLADDAAGTTREVASVLSGRGLLRAQWSRDLPEAADGVVGLPAGLPAGVRVVASSGDELLSFDAGGETVARLKTTVASGRLLDFGAAADGARELVGFRPGGTSIGVIALRSGTERAIAIPAPLLDVAISGGAAGDARRLTFATLRGAASAGPNDALAALREGGSSVRAVAANPARGVLALREDGTMGPLQGSSPVWPHPPAGAARLLTATEDRAVVGPRTIVAAVSGRFLAGGGRALAVATYAGHLAIVDENTGNIVFDAVWTGIHDLGAVDLDGDGRDELLVAAGRSVTALGSAGP
jgi:thiol-disulfide isomerase/thioredoxin